MKIIAAFSLLASVSVALVGCSGRTDDSSSPTPTTEDELRTRSRGPLSAGTYIAGDSGRLAPDGMNSLRAKGEILTLALKTNGTFYRSVSTQDDCLDGDCTADSLEGHYSFSKASGKSEYVFKNANGDEVERWEVKSTRDSIKFTNVATGIVSNLDAGIRTRWCKTKSDCGLQDEGVSNPTGKGYRCDATSGGIDDGRCISLGDP